MTDQEPHKIWFDGSIFHDILTGDGHPHGTVFSAGNSDGKLLHFDTKTCDLLEEISLGQGQIRALKYSPRGTFLGLGTANGYLFYWPALEGLERNEPIKCSNKSIKILEFSQDESVMIYVDDNDTIGILEGPDPWSIQARIKIHTRPVTGLTFWNHSKTSHDFFSVGLDRKICHVENNHMLKAKQMVDRRYDPVVISVFRDFLLVGNTGSQVRFINPETLLCRRIISVGGIPKAFFHPSSEHCLMVSQGGISLVDPAWSTHVNFWNIGEQGVLKVIF